MKAERLSNLHIVSQLVKWYDSTIQVERGTNVRTSVVFPIS